MAFTNSIPWDKYVTRTDALRKSTKEDIVKFANAHYGNNYDCVQAHGQKTRMHKMDETFHHKGAVKQRR